MAAQVDPRPGDAAYKRCLRAKKSEKREHEAGSVRRSAVICGSRLYQELPVIFFFFDQTYLYYDSRKTYTYMGQNRYALEGYRRDMQPTQLAQRTLHKQKITRRSLVPTVLAELAVRCQTPTPKPKPTVEP